MRDISRYLHIFIQQADTFEVLVITTAKDELLLIIIAIALNSLLLVMHIDYSMDLKSGQRLHKKN